MNRSAEINRRTSETDISIRLDLDGTGEARLDYPLGFMRHMLNTFARHGLFDLNIRAQGDLDVDQHHLVEDTGLVLGRCFVKALAAGIGIRRVGNCLFPMDETLARAAVDISGRPFLVFKARFENPGLGAAAAGQGSGGFEAGLVEDFWQAFASAAGITLHLDIIRGRSDHHKIEALFKAAARALREAVEIDPRAQEAIPSTKGTLA